MQTNYAFHVKVWEILSCHIDFIHGSPLICGFMNMYNIFVGERILWILSKSMGT